MIAKWLAKSAPTHFAQKYTLGHDRLQHLLEARKGRGKTYTMTAWAYQCVKKKIRVAANFHFNIREFAMRLVIDRVWPSFESALTWCRENIRYVNTWDEIMMFYDGALFLDEINRLFDSQDKAKDDRVPRVVLEWLQLSRRNLVTLVCAAQSMDWLTNRIRQLFDVLWRAKKEMGRGRQQGKILRFWLYGGDPWAKGLSADAQRSADYKVTLPFDSSIFRLYDTLERIQAIDNKSRFEKFYDVYQEQLALGIVPPPSAPPPESLKCGLCFARMGHRASAATSAPREESSAAEGHLRTIGRHGYSASRVERFPVGAS